MNVQIVTQTLKATFTTNDGRVLASTYEVGKNCSLLHATVKGADALELEHGLKVDVNRVNVVEAR